MSEHELWNELGNLYFMSGAYNQAVHAYRRSIGLDANFGRPYSNLALTYVQQGKYDEAIELYRASIELLAENKEKAISWNRLGAVYRHLKDYSKAVIAFQEADELDPHSVDEFPVDGEPHNEALQVPTSVLDQAVGERKEPESEIAWWDVDEDPTLAARLAMQGASDLPDELISSWTGSDPSLYQQDISQTPETGSLTTWGDSEFEDDFEVSSPLDPEPDVHVPGPDDDDLSTWLPVPEEEPLRLDLDQVPIRPEETAAAHELQPGWNESSHRPVINAESFVPLLPARASISGVSEYSERNERHPNRQMGGQQTALIQDLDVDLQERPSADFAGMQRQPDKTVAADPVELEAPHDAPDTLESTPAPVDVPELERDADELHEIETGIAKFKRVVQLNPRNAHAWDALGTLYKSAGLYKDAILAYQQAISNDGTKSLYFHHLGLVYACEGRDEDAIGAFQRVIEIDPEYSLAHATLGGYYRKMGLEELAQKHIGKAMKNIFDTENEYNRACLEAICGNADQAIELLGVALKNKQTYVDWILRDPDLDFIRQDPRFKQLISDYTR